MNLKFNQVYEKYITLAEKDYFLNGTYSEKVRDRIIEAFEDFVYSENYFADIFAELF